MQHQQADNSSPDRYEQFVRLFTRHEQDLRSFVRSLLPSWHDTDDVMQEVALAVWRKFDQFQPGTEFLRWAYVIARFEVLSYRRQRARDRLVFSEDLLTQLADEALVETEQREAERRALEPCLEQLAAGQRELIMAAYTSGVKITGVAERLGTTPGSLYMRLNRIRRRLLLCIEHRLRQENV